MTRLVAMDLIGTINSLTKVAPAWALVAAVCSVLVAVGALGVSISNRRIAKRALRLSEAKARREEARLEVNQITCVESRWPDGERRIDALIQIANLSELANSVRSVALWVNHRIEGKVMSSEFSAVETDPSGLFPTRLQGKETIQCTVSFRLASARVGGWVIDSYDLEVTDTDGRVATLERLSIKAAL